MAGLAAADLEVRLDLDLGVGHDPRPGEGGVVAAETVVRRDPAARAGDRRDAPVAEREEMLHRLAGARRVRGRHRRDAVVEAEAGVDDDEVVARVEQARELVARLLREHDERSVGEAVHHPVDLELLPVVLVAGVREHRPEVALVQRLRRAREDRREVDGVDERHEDADEPRPAGRQAPGAAVRDVAPVADDLRDELTRLGGDVVAAVEDAGDGGDGHAGLLRHLTDGHPARCELRPSRSSKHFRNVYGRFSAWFSQKS